MHSDNIEYDPTPYKNLKKYMMCIGLFIGAVIIVAFVRIAIINWWSGPDEDVSQKSPTGYVVPRSYTFYTKDKRVGGVGEARVYLATETDADWVTLTNREAGLFEATKVRTIWFQPSTLQGKWKAEIGGKLQRGEVLMAKDAYGGFEIQFTYDGEEHAPSLGTLVPGW